MRHRFGSTADYVITAGSGNAAILQPGAAVTCWNAAVGGTQHTDLTDIDGSTPIAGSTLTADSKGAVPEFFGPDGVTELYFDANGGAGPRRRTTATDLGSTDVANLRSDLDAHKANSTNPHGVTASDVGAVPNTGGTVNGPLSITGRLTNAGFTLPMAMPSSRRPNYRQAFWQQQFQTGHGWSASGSGVASSGDDTSVFCKGTQSYRVTTTGTGAVANIRKLAGTLPDLTGKSLRLTFRVSDVTHLNQINVQIGTSTIANTFNWRLHTHSATADNQVQSGEWVSMVIGWADVRSVTGSYTIGSTGVPSTTSGFTDFVFQVVDDNTANPITVNLQAVEVIPGTVASFPQGVVSITFDDSYASQYTLARPKMDALGYRGTLYTIADVIDTSSYLSMAQLRAMHDAGWEVAGHAYTAANHNAKFHTLPAQTVEDEMRLMRMWMVRNGFPSDHFAYPGGWFTKTTDGVPIDQLTCRYYASGRGISSADNYETFPPGQAHRMRSITGIGSLAGASSFSLPANLTKTGGTLDRCKLSGSWTILTFHEVVAGTAATSNQCSQTDFNSIMDGIASRGIPVLPVGEVLRNL